MIRADRALCAGDPSHYFENVDTSGDGVPDNEFSPFSMAVPTEDAYWDNLSTGDVDGDGDLDLLISHSSSVVSPHALQLNDGTGAFTLYNAAAMAPTHSAADDFSTFTGNAHDMALVDLDADRDLDLVIGGGNHGSAKVNFVLLDRLTETGELFFESSRFRSRRELSATVHVGTPDLNGDGRRDIHFVNDYGRAGTGRPAVPQPRTGGLRFGRGGRLPRRADLQRRRPGGRRSHLLEGRLARSCPKRSPPRPRTATEPTTETSTPTATSTSW